MCPRKPDREEADLLQELQRLQARERLPDIEPPALIDQAVRNMARRNLPHQRSPNAGKLRWIAGLSTASVALIALGISLVQTPTPPSPGTDSFDRFETRELESISSSEKSKDAAPAAHSRSRSARAPEADAALVTQEMAVDSGNDPAPAEQQQSPVQTRSLATESALADHDISTAAEMSESMVNGSQQAREQSAQAWLDLIEQLREQGLETESLGQLRAWRAQYPDLPLPDWATALLQDPP